MQSDPPVLAFIDRPVWGVHSEGERVSTDSTCSLMCRFYQVTEVFALKTDEVCLLLIAISQQCRKYNPE